MSGFSFLFKLPTGSAAAILLLGAIHSGAAFAQATAPAAPATASTLDVCEDSTTGNWRYSGVVSVLAPEGKQAPVSVDYWIQNQSSRAGFSDALKAHQGAGSAAVLHSGDVQIVPFSIDAPALTLGTLRPQARVQVLGQSSDAKVAPVLVQGAEVTQPVCGCGPTGCVRTQGYWGNKPNVDWPGDWYRQMNFYSSGMSWQQVYDAPPRGNAYIMLADQFMTAVLNRNAGASAPQGVQDVMAAARDWFASGTTLQTCSGHGACMQQKIWAGILDVYNNGFYPGGPPHCKDGHGKDGDDKDDHHGGKGYQTGNND